MTERQPPEELKVGEARAPYIVGQETEKALRNEMRSHFRWTMGLLFPIVLSVVAMLIQMFLVGAP